MAGFLRYVSVQMVITDYGGAPYGPYPSRSQFFRSNFSGYPNGYGYTGGGVPLSRPQFYPNGYGYTGGGVPLSRPNGYVYTQVWQEEDSSEEVDDVQVKKGDSENNNALHKCFKFIADWFYQFYDNFDLFLDDFKEFLYNLKYYMDTSTEFLEHLNEFMASLNRIMEEWNDMKANLANDGTLAAGDSYHCYHYYNYNYYNNNSNSGCCPCTEFRRGGSPSPSNGGDHPGVRREKVVQKCCKLCNPPKAKANSSSNNPTI